MHLHLVQNIPIPIMIAYIPYAYVMLTGCVWPTIVQFSILLQFTGEKRYIHFVVMDAPQYTTTGSSNIRKTAAAIPNFCCTSPFQETKIAAIPPESPISVRHTDK